MARPIGIEIDDQDRVIVTDARGKIMVYSKDKTTSPPRLREARCRESSAG